jgi:hypothetical protein
MLSITEVYDTSVNTAQIKADAAAKPAGWSGCYGNSNAAIFKDYGAIEGSLTEARCTATCKTKGFGWVGLANSNACRCSQTDPTTVAQRWPSKQYCNSPCSGDNKQTCGAPGQYIDVFNKTAALADNSTAIDGYKGCYSGIVGLTGATWTQTNMDLGVCQTGCKELGYSLAGNSGNACYCGSSVSSSCLCQDLWLTGSGKREISNPITSAPLNVPVTRLKSVEQTTSPPSGNLDSATTSQSPPAT